MFFGLGQRVNSFLPSSHVVQTQRYFQLRKCGFDVISIENRVQLVQFCLRNPEFTVISTGKAYKEVRSLGGRMRKSRFNVLFPFLDSHSTAEGPLHMSGDEQRQHTARVAPHWSTMPSAEDRNLA